MNAWEWLYRIGPGWPTERQWVTIMTYVLGASLLKMAETYPSLWDVKLFEVILQAVILQGLLNMVLAFHFSANKSDEVKVENTGKGFDAIKAVAESNTNPPAGGMVDNMEVAAENVTVTKGD